jgi:predicted DCC family thiol-disulfide oxidoreductase YuxK
MAKRATVALLKAYGLLRIGFSLLYLHTLTQTHVLLHPLVFPKSYWVPVSLAHWLGGNPPEVALMATLGLTAFISTVCMGVGFLTRVASPIALVSGAMLLCISQSFGKVSHNTQSLVLFLMVFQFADWGSYFSVDAWRRWSTRQLPVIHADWHPYYLLWIFLAVMAGPYFCSGWFKVLKGHFIQPGYINSIVAAKQVVWAAAAPIPAFSQSLKGLFLGLPLLGNALAWLTLLVEMGFVLALTSAGARVVMVGLAVALHAAITLTTKILFFEHMVLMAMVWGLCLYLYQQDNPALKPSVVETTPTPLPIAATWRLPLLVMLAMLLLMGVLPGALPHWLGNTVVYQDRWVAMANAMHGVFPINSNYFDAEIDLWVAGGLMLATTVVLGLFALRWLRQVGQLIKGPKPAIDPVFVYDGDCGFCARSVQTLRALRAQVAFVSNYNAQPLLAEAGLSLPETQRFALYLEWTPQGWVVQRGAAAVNAALARCSGLWPGLPLRLLSVLYGVAGIQQVQNIVYRWVANNRHRLGPPGACALPGISGPGLSGSGMAGTT